MPYHVTPMYFYSRCNYQQTNLDTSSTAPSTPVNERRYIPTISSAVSSKSETIKRSLLSKFKRDGKKPQIIITHEEDTVQPASEDPQLIVPEQMPERKRHNSLPETEKETQESTTIGANDLDETDNYEKSQPVKPSEDATATNVSLQEFTPN